MSTEARMPAEVDVCVIGSGLAGIAAALSARQAGAQVVVLEATERAGGKAKTVSGMECGPSSFNGRYEVFWQVLEQLGLKTEAIELPASASTRYLARFGRLHTLKPSPLTLFSTGALTFSEKTALVRDALIPRDVQRDASLHDFFAARFGVSFAEGPLAAMISGIFTGDPRRLAVDGCFPDLVERATAERSVIRGLMKGPKTGRKGLFTLKGGLGRMGEAAQKLLPIELDSPVRELTRDANGFTVHARRVLHARCVVVATEAAAAAKLLWPVSPKLGAALGQLEYAPVTVVHWEGEETGFGPGFGYLACPSEALFAMGTMFHDQAGAPRRFRSFVRGVEADDAQLSSGIDADVKKLTGGRFGKLLRVDRWPHAVFQPTVEALPVRATLPALADEAGVVLAGSHLGASAMKDALASGLAAGKRAHQASQRTHAWSRSLS
jgi:oxygen-dependent protoporphyrinogen oxidase